MNSYDLKNTENGTTFSKLQHELYFRNDRSVRVSHFHMQSGNRIAQKCQFIFLPVSIFAYVGTTAGTVNNKSERCRSLRFFLFPLEKDEKFMLLLKLCPTVDQITFVRKHIALTNATKILAKYSQPQVYNFQDIILQGF